MKRKVLIVVAGLMSATITWAAGINYNGTNLQENTEFTRTQCGTAYKDVMTEISGLACSRTTPGYLWAHGDENTGSNKKIIAINPNASSKNNELVMTVNISGDPGRDDWEDIATGVYNNTNYVFIGAFGDNDLKNKDNYYIYYFEEPAITSGNTITKSVNYIRFGYPDNQPHNTETLMYDNIEQMFYIADKVENGVCHLYKLPFRTDYGTSVQTVTQVCALGNGSVFNYITGGDISPDGKWMAIKNKPYALLWERQGSESLATTAQRDPVQIMAYEAEKQGESFAWLDASTFYTTSDQKKDMPIYKYVRTIVVDPTVAEATSITIDGVALTGFAADNFTYNVVLPYGTTSMPQIEATAANEGTVQVNLPLSIPGAATVVCTSKDGQNSVTYTINLTVSATPATDATLATLKVNGSLISGFSASTLDYTYQIAYTDALPVVTAEANESHANVQINNVTEVTKTGTNATVVVMAQDGQTSLTYTITFSRKDFVKKLNEVIMTNKYSAFIPESDSTKIRAYYIAGEAVPTVQSHSEGDGTTWSQSGSVITLTGADETSVSYNLVVEPVTPVAFTTDEIVCNGSETWIKSAYGWDSSKKWRFSKTDSDYTREMNGKTHVELFLPSCDTIVLKAGGSNERAVRFYINGVQLGDKVTLAKAGTTLVVEQSAPFMLTVASAQTSGDGGVASVRMARKSATALDEVLSGAKAEKVLHDGQIYILRDGKVYTVTGEEVK